MRDSLCLNALDWIAIVLIIIGGLNWGLLAFASYNLVGAIFGDASTASRIVYGLVGLAAIYMLFISFGKLRRCSCDYTPTVVR